MKMYLELEGKLCPKPRPQSQTQLWATQPQPSTSTHPQNTNPTNRKASGAKASDKRKRTMLIKRRYKVRVFTQPIPSTPTSTTPAPIVAIVTTQTPVVRSAAESIPVMVYKLATGKFAEVQFQTTRSQNKGSNLPPLEDIPNAPVRQGTPWPSTGSASKNLFETRKDWPIPPTPTPTSAPTLNTEAPTQVVVIPHVMVMPKQVAEKCSWGLHCPICKNEEEHEEDWDSDIQREQPRMCPQNTQCPQVQDIQFPQPQNTQHPQLFDVPDRCSEQTQLRREWEEKIEWFNEKYNLDYYFSSESDSKPEPEHRYEHKYETCI